MTSSPWHRAGRRADSMMGGASSAQGRRRVADPRDSVSAALVTVAALAARSLREPRLCPVQGHRHLQHQQQHPAHVRRGGGADPGPGAEGGRTGGERGARARAVISFWPLFLSCPQARAGEGRPSLGSTPQAAVLALAAEQQPGRLGLTLRPAFAPWEGRHRVSPPTIGRGLVLRCPSGVFAREECASVSQAGGEHPPRNLEPKLGHQRRVRHADKLFVRPLCTRGRLCAWSRDRPVWG